MKIEEKRARLLDKINGEVFIENVRRLDLEVKKLREDVDYLKRCVLKPPTQFSFDKENNDG